MFRIADYFCSISSLTRRTFSTITVAGCLLGMPLGFAGEDALTSPVHFQNYQEIFSHIADANELFNDPEMILQLSNECRVEYPPDAQKDGQTRAVMALNLMDNGVNILRGASGNGVYYVIQSTATGLDLVGILEGNSWKHQVINDRDAFVTTWHMSAEEYVETTYEWNGSVFAKTNSRTVKETE